MISLNDEIDLAHMHAVLSAEYVWHLTIDLDDHYLGTFDDGPLPHICGPKLKYPPSSMGQVLKMAMSTGSRSAGNNQAPLPGSAVHSCNGLRRVSCGRRLKNAS